MDALAGYRRLTFDDSFRAQADVTAVAARFLPGTRISSRDEVATDGTYDGLTLGLDWAVDGDVPQREHAVLPGKDVCVGR